MDVALLIFIDWFWSVSSALHALSAHQADRMSQKLGGHDMAIVYPCGLRKFAGLVGSRLTIVIGVIFSLDLSSFDS
jgi:hypothetical protein